MNRDDIIRWAREVGCEETRGMDAFRFTIEELERFAALVAAAKQEAMLRDGWRQCAVGQGTTQFCALTEQAVKAEREACLSILLAMEKRKWAVIALGGELSGCSLHDAYMAIRARGDK